MPAATLTARLAEDNGPAPAELARSLPPQVLRDWSRAAELLCAPEGILALDDAAFEGLVLLLRDERVLPLFIHRLTASRAWLDIPGRRRAELDAWLMHAKAGWVKIIEEVEHVLGRLAGADLCPILLKGCHVGPRYYEAPYLRPTTDVDLLFTDLAQAERAFGLLRAGGYVPMDPVRGGSPWLWSRHLPELRNPETGVRVEAHGSLLFAPTDRRDGPTRLLLENPEEIPVGARRAFALRSEAAILYALAHAFERHAADVPRMTSLLDTAMIAKERGERLDWPLLEDLARRSGLAGPAALGLWAAREFAGAAVPGSVITALAAGAGPSTLALGEGRTSARQSLQALRNAKGPGVLLRKLFYVLFPAPAYLRARRPEDRRPLPLLYLALWARQVGKLAGLARARAERAGRLE